MRVGMGVARRSPPEPQAVRRMVMSSVPVTRALLMCGRCLMAHLRHTHSHWLIMVQQLAGRGKARTPHERVRAKADSDLPGGGMDFTPSRASAPSGGEVSQGAALPPDRFCTHPPR